MKEKVSKEKRPKSVLPILQKIFSENSIKFNMEWENEDGERVGTIIVEAKGNWRRDIVKDEDVLIMWTWKTMIRNMEKLKEGREKVPELKDINIIEFILPDEIVYQKINGELILRKIENEIRGVYKKFGYPFKVMLTTDKEEIIIE